MALMNTQEEEPSSSDFMPRPWTHDVFVSFSGEDTRKGFTDHLYAALIRAGIHTFRDENELRRGEDISLEVLKAIEESRIAVIVFSSNYASSIWCLDELLKILECKRTIGQTVLPVFYDVDPSDVRKQSGTFAQAFARHETRFKLDTGKVQRWRKALTDTANLSGWELRSIANGHESKFIQKIVEEILTKVNQTPLFVAKYPVGIASRVAKINDLLDFESNDVSIVGIWGMGGVGKTTIAKAIYNVIFDKFEGSSFLANVRESSEQPNGLVHLQEQLLFDILQKKNLQISNVARGVNIIKERLRCKRVLIILDDVDQLYQFNAFCGGRRFDWFGSGSKIIVTTRDKDLVKQLEVDEVFEAAELSFSESLQLFSCHAFRKNSPLENYMELSKSVVKYVGGLPLALEVIGSSLFCKRSIPEWESTLNKLKSIRHNQIQKILRISFDGLDDTQKDTFLDIACFFIGRDKDDACRILEGCGFFPEIGIKDLVQRSLIAIDNQKKLCMHHLLRDMGREIIHEESPKEPGKRSRLWFHEDVYYVLTKHKGTEAVEGLILDNSSQIFEVPLNTKVFTKMQKLRLLQINYVQLMGSYELLPKELRWLCWHGFPLTSIPSSFSFDKLVDLDMQHSRIKIVWKEFKLLQNLKVLNLSHCNCLIKTPNFLGLPNLERLILESCKTLDEVHQSIGYLDKLSFLNLQDCSNLINLPSSICKLTSLENFVLSGCSKLANLPEDLGNMESLVELLVDGTAITGLPLSIRRLRNLKTLSLRGSKRPLSRSWSSLFSSWRSPKKGPNLMASFSGLYSLRELDLGYCNLSDAAIPNDFGSLLSLQTLKLSGNNFCSLPASIKQLSHLESLTLNNCPRLELLPELPSSLVMLTAKRCTSMERLPVNMGLLSKLYMVLLNDCTRLQSLPDDLPSSLATLNIEACKSLECLPNLENLPSLHELHLSNNNFRSLPASISQLSHLRTLYMRNCTELESLPDLPTSLRNLFADGCTSKLLTESKKEVEIAEIESSESPYKKLPDIVRKSLLQGLFGQFDIFLTGSDVPEWFSYQSSGSSLAFEVPQLLDSKIQGLTVCAIFAAEVEGNEVLAAPSISFSNKTNGRRWSYTPNQHETPITRQDQIWFGHIPHTEFKNPLECGDQVEVSVEIEQYWGYFPDIVSGNPFGLEHSIQVKKCGIHLVYQPAQKGSHSNVEEIIEDIDSSCDSMVDDGDGPVVINAGSKRSSNDIEVLSINSLSSEGQDPKRLRF
ncbi:disease resistance protein RPV1-like [Telopea speciosissima]|uniref:disease resistance protein RPV1-like n=1 Tax=Telopea speciosissima TaxID=54955 RepID=UPI001CC7FCCB|nr:disease resistance protein RPV1-like [Telopea speciosissima]